MFYVQNELQYLHHMLMLTSGMVLPSTDVPHVPHLPKQVFYVHVQKRCLPLIHPHTIIIRMR